MAGAATLAAVVLAAVFAWAAIAKAVRHRETVAAFAGLGLPSPGLLGTVVPAAEMVVAFCLVVWPPVGAALALAALAAFTLVVIRALGQATGAGCGCFGSRRIEPVSPTDVIRNGILAALAAVATGTTRLVRPGPGAVAAMAAVVVGAAAALVVAERVFGRPPAPRA